MTNTKTQEINTKSLFDDKKVFVVSDASINNPQNKAKVYEICDSELSELQSLLMLN